MALLVKDRIKETTSTTGTGTLTLAGAVAGYQAFSVLGNGATTYYALTDANGTAWEVGLGTYTTSGTTLARTTVLGSSNSGSKITLTSGTHDVFVTYPAGKAGFNDQGIAKTFTADGSITAGKPCILEADGKAQQIGNTDTTVINVSNASAGRQTLAAGTVKYPSTVYDTGSDRFVTAYTDAGNSDYGTAVVYQISNATTGAITYGTPVVFESAEADPNADYDGLVYDANANKVLIAYQDRADSRKGKAIVGTVTGGSNAIAFGTAAEFEAGETTSIHAAYDSNANKSVIIYRDADDSNKGKSVVATISSTSVSFGSLATFHDAQTRTMSIAFDSDNNKFLIVYEDDGNTQGEAVVGTISSTDITFGTVQTFTTDTINYVGIGYDENVNKFLISYSDAGDSHYSKMIVATIAGTDVSFGSEVAVASEYNYAPNVIYDPDLQKNAIAYYDSTNDVGKVHYVAISSTTPSVVTSHTFDSADIASQTVTGAYDVDNDKLVLTYKDEASDLSSIMIDANFGTNLTASNYLGVASTTATNTNPVDINIVGSINNNQTGLTVGDDYFCNTSGEIKKFLISTTATNTDPTVKALTTMDGSDKSTDKVASTYEATSGTYVMAYRDTTNSNYGTMVAGTWADGTITWGTPYVAGSYAIDSNGLDITAGDGYVALQLYRVGVSTYMKVYSISGTSFTNTESQTIWNGSPVATGGNKTTWIPSSSLSLTDGGVACGIVFCVYSHDDSGTDKTFGRAFAIKKTTGAETGKSAEASFITTNAHMNRANLVTDPDNAKAIYSTYDASDGDVGKSFVFGFGGTGASPTHTVGTGVDFSGSDDAPLVSSIYDPDNDQVVIVWRNLSGGTYTIKGCIGTINAGTNAITYSADTTLISTGVNHISQYDITYDQDSNKIIFYYNDGSNSDAFTYKVITSTGSALSIADGAVISANNCKLQTDSASSGVGKGTMCAVQDNSNSNYVSYTTIYYGETTTHTKTDSQYIGKALSATALELKDQDSNTLYGQSEGAVTKGKPVIVEADGDFSEVTQPSTNNTGSADTGSNVQYSTHGEEYSALAYSTDGGTVMAVYWSSSSVISVKAGTRSTNAITWGSELNIDTGNSQSGTQNSITYDDNAGCFVVTYGDYASPASWEVACLTVSGTTATLVSTTEIRAESPTTRNNSVCYDPDNKVCVAVCQTNDGVGSTMYAHVLTVASGGSSVTVSATSSYSVSGTSGVQYVEVAYLGNSTYGIYYRNGNVSYYPQITLGTISGTTISWGTQTTINSATGGYCSIVYNPQYTGKCFVMGRVVNSSYTAVPISFTGTTATIGTVSDGNVTSGSLSIENSCPVGSYSDYSGQYLATYASSNYLKYKYGTTSNGVSITWGSELGATATSANYSGVISNDNTGFHTINFQASSNNSSKTLQPTFDYTKLGATNLTTENYIGIAQETASDNATIIVQTVGATDNNQSSLTPGQIYYVQEDGTLALTADTTSVVAGQAISATKLLISRS